MWICFCNAPLEARVTDVDGGGEKTAKARDGKERRGG